MKIIAYIYCDLLLEPVPENINWQWEVERVYEDFVKGVADGYKARSQLQQLLTDCQNEPVECLLIRRLEELGDTVEEVSDRLNELEAMGVAVIATEQSYTSEQAHFRADLLKLLQEIQYQQRSRRIRQGH